MRKIYFFSRGGQRQLSLTWRNVKRNSLRFLREETIKKIVSLLTCANWKVSLPGDQGEGLYIHTYISRYILPANIATDWLNGSLLRSRANRWNRKSSRQHEPRCVCSFFSFSSSFFFFLFFFSFFSPRLSSIVATASKYYPPE